MAGFSPAPLYSCRAHHLSVHLVWVTKYRYPVLKGDLKVRCRDLLRQVCMTLDVRILKGVVSKDHVHMHVDYPSTLCVSDLVKRLKSRSSRLLQREYPSLRKRFWGRHFCAIGYLSTKDITLAGRNNDRALPKVRF